MTSRRSQKKQEPKLHQAPFADRTERTLLIPAQHFTTVRQKRQRQLFLSALATVPAFMVIS
jgi:hypothetical protein